jgi:hypothetical protein
MDLTAPRRWWVISPETTRHSGSVTRYNVAATAEVMSAAGAVGVDLMGAATWVERDAMMMTAMIAASAAVAVNSSALKAVWRGVLYRHCRQESPDAHRTSPGTCCCRAWA